MFEQVTRTGEATQSVHYLFAGGRRIAVYTEDDAATTPSETLRYVHTDHLGSVDTLTDESGAVVERLSYDAWGKRRIASGANAWRDAVVPIAGAETRRGFTGHEHLDEFELIHMNGRVYDPSLGRFLSADPFIQFPASTQGLNRYSYVFNNPLSFTDPSGYFIKWLGRKLDNLFDGIGQALESVLKSQIGQTVITIAAGIACNGAAAACMAAVSGAFTAINGGSLGDAILAAGLTYVSAEAFGAAGDASGAEFLSAEHLKTTLAHGVVGGVTAEVSGGHFRDGFLAAGAAQFAAPGVGRIATRTGRAMAAAAVGGTASKLGGGKFANGAVTAAFARLYGEAYREAQRTRFKTQHDAARTILDEVNPRSIKENREYGGLVYENPDGTYSVTQPIQGTIDSVDPGAATLVGVPSKSTMTAYYHTHGANTPGYFNELFSGIPGVTGNYGDIPYANHFGIDGYLATPSGAFQHYDHRTGAIATLGRVSVR